MFEELKSFSYKDSDVTKTVQEFIKTKSGICYDFVNYIHNKNDKAKCYFWYHFVCEYIPENISESIKSFCNKRFKQNELIEISKSKSSESLQIDIYL